MRPSLRLWWLLLVVIVFVPVAGSAVYVAPGSAGGTWWPGASATAPEQREGTPGSGLPGQALPVAARDTPRPHGGVPDRAPVPEARRYEPPKQDIRPEGKLVPSSGGFTPDKSVERDRTERTQTFVNPDGTHTLRMHTRDTHIRRPDGTLTPMDLTLVPDAAGTLRPRAGSGSLGFGRGADLSVGDLGYRLENTADVPAQPDAATAKYPGLMPGVDAVFTALPGGIQETLTLTAPVGSVTAVLRTKDLEPKFDPESGAVTLTGKDGTVHGTLPPRTVVDAKGVQSEAKYSVSRAGDVWRVHTDLRIEQAAFPVTVEAAVTVKAATDDVFIRSGATPNPGSVQLETGKVAGQPIARAYLHFNALQSALSNKYVNGVTFNANTIYTGPNCPKRPVSVFEVTKPWDASSIRWPGAPVGQALGTATFAHGEGCGAPNWGHVPIHPDHLGKFTAWTHGAPFHGLSLRATNENDAAAGKRFGSANSPNAPYLDVTYSDEGASYQVDGLTLPFNQIDGEIRATVTNLGTSTWHAGGGFRLGYIVRRPDGSVAASSPGTGPLTTIAPMAKGEFKVPLAGVQPGKYDVRITMFDPQGRSFHETHGVPYLEFPMEVRNLPPTSNRQEPGNGAPVETRNPTLYAEGKDVDNWPNTGLKYKFIVCTDTELSKDCHESGWGPQSWAPERDKLRWSTTYYWAVKVSDNVSETPNWIGPLALTTRVPQPQITAHLGDSAGSGDAPGLGTQVGNFTTSVTDASVATAGPDLTVTRTYNSLDPRRDTAFGIGWSSRLDMRMREDNDGSGGLVITYPNGRQVRVGRNPDVNGKRDYAAPAGQNLTLVYDDRAGTYTLRDATGGRWVFDARLLLVRTVDADGLTERLDYTGNDQVSLITNEVSGRYLRVTWKGKHVETVQTAAPDAASQPLTWTYHHEGDRLVKACVPGAAPNCTTYEYEVGSHYRSTVMDDRPVAYWRLAETTGETAANAAARNDGANPGTYRNVVRGTTGAVGGTADKAVSFDGTGSHVTLPERLATDTMSLSAELWFRTTGQGVLLATTDQPFPAEAKQNTPVLYVGTDGMLYGGFGMRDVTGPHQVVSTKAVDDGQWHHVVVSAGIDHQKMYLDGAPQGEVRGLIDHGNRGHLVLGAGSGKDWPATNGGDFYFAGDIDEVALYRHPLGELAARQHHLVGQSADQLTKIVLPQDDRVRAQVRYDDIQDRVRTLTDHNGRQWTLDAPKMSERKEGDKTIAHRTVTLRGPRTTRTYVFDAGNNGRIVQRDDNGLIKKYEYNAKDFSSITIDENGHRTERVTDDRGNTLSTKTCRAKDSCNTSYATYVKPSADPLDPRTDKLESSSDARSSGPDDTRYRTTQTYDVQGRVETISSPAPRGSTGPTVQTFTYAKGTEAAVGGGLVPAGLLVKSTGKRGQETRNGYRKNGDLAEALEPTGLRSKFEHDEIGRRKSVTLTNATGAPYGTTSYTYTPRSQVETITEPEIVNEVTKASHVKVTKHVYDGNGNPVSTTISDGKAGDTARTTLFEYDAHDRLAKTTYPDGGVQKVSHEDSGYTQVLTDVRGFRWTSQFDGRDLLQVRDVSGPGVDPQNPDATVLTVESRGYDNAGRLMWVEDSMRRRTTYGYYDDGQLATTTRNGYVGPDGVKRDVTLEKRGYDAAGNLTELVQAGGRTTTTEYDEAGYVTKSTFDPGQLKRVTAYTRDRDGNAESLQLSGAANPGRTEITRYAYDAGNLVIREDAELDDGISLSKKYDRDERGLVKRMTNRRLQTTTYTYDVTGQVVTTSAPAADIWVNGTRQAGFIAKETLGRNTFGEVTHSRDAAGGVTQTQHDTMGRAVAGILPEYTPPGGQPIRDATTRTEYDKAGNAVKTIDPLNRVTEQTFDPYGRPLVTTLPKVDDLPNTVITRYNRNGELATQISPSGAEQRFTYDELGRQITAAQVERYPGPVAVYTSKTGYDDAGNVTSTATPQGYTSTAEYNAAGEMLVQTDPTNRKSTFGYDDAGRQVRQVDPTGLVTLTDFDRLGRSTAVRQQVNDVDRRIWRTEPDENGNIVSSTSPEGRVTTADYDALDRKVNQTERIDDTRGITVSLGYDAIGNRSRFVDGEKRVTTYGYTPWGLPHSVVDPGGATRTTVYDAASQLVKQIEPGNVVRERTYDAQGRVKLEKGTGASVATTDRTFGYDADGRVTKVGGPRGDSGYTYDDRGNVIGSSGAAGIATYAYNGDNLLASRTDASGAGTFEYDRAGRLAIVKDPLTTGTMSYLYEPSGRLKTLSGNGSVREYDYDEFGRVKSDKVGQFGVGYTYDLDDKVRTKTQEGKTSQYGYDGAGRLTSWRDPAGKLTEYGWDLAGNRTSAGGVTYAYDEANRLKSGGGSTYNYTERGTLAGITTNGQTRTFAFDAFDRMTADGAVSYRYDSLDRVADKNTSAFQYAGLSNEAVSDGRRLVSRLPDGTALSDKSASGAAGLLFADARGDVVARHTGGAVGGTRVFDPFGSAIASTGENASIGYQGDWTDADTGAVNMTARWYLPGAGAFASRDDWNNPPEPSSAANRYAYGNNDPMGNIDPTGHSTDTLAPPAPSTSWMPSLRSVFWFGLRAANFLIRRTIVGFITGTISDHIFGNPSGDNLRIIRGFKRYDPPPTPPNPTNPQPTGPGPGQGPGPGPGTGPGPVVPPIVVPPVVLPPPPPPWLIYALQTLVRPAAGSTVAAQPRIKTYKLRPDQIVDTGNEYVNGATKITYWDEAAEVNPNFQDGDTDENEESCLDGNMPHTVWYGPYDDVKKRATGAMACLTMINKSPRDPKMPPVSGIKKDSGYSEAKAHLIAHVFFGENRKENLVPFNQPKGNSSLMYHHVEKRIRARVEAGERVFYRVTPVYEDYVHPGRDPRNIDKTIPVGFSIYAKGSQGYNCALYIPNLKESHPNYGGC